MNAARWDTLTWRAITVTVAAAAALAWFGALTPTVEAALLAVAVIAGLPHGAADLDVARARWPSADRVRLVAGYLATAATVVAVWRMSPDVALGLFLAASAWHFGAGDTPHRPRGALSGAAAAARGTLVLAVPIASSPADVARLFGALGADALAAIAVAGWAASGAVVAAGALYVTTTWRSASNVDRLADVVLFAWLAWAPPLVGFAVYFAAWHSPRHLLRLDRARVETSRARTLALTAASILGLVGAILWIAAGGADVPTAAVRAIFVALAALTVPHMLLVETKLGREAATA